ncbi:hypothetical protein Hanom_Chr11g01058621 [Helianthus anomalus]
MQRIAKELECNEASRDGDLARECMRRIAKELECNEASRYGDFCYNAFDLLFGFIGYIYIYYNLQHLYATRVVHCAIVPVLLVFLSG